MFDLIWIPCTVLAIISIFTVVKLTFILALVIETQQLKKVKKRYIS